MIQGSRSQENAKRFQLACKPVPWHRTLEYLRLHKSPVILHIKKNETSNIGCHLRTEEDRNTIPILLTVAGDALSTLSGSNTNLLFWAIVIRSPLAKVRVLLSSSTEFRFSIQTASTGPSNAFYIILMNDSTGHD